MSLLNYYVDTIFYRLLLCGMILILFLLSLFWLILRLRFMSLRLMFTALWFIFYDTVFKNPVTVAAAAYKWWCLWWCFFPLFDLKNAICFFVIFFFSFLWLFSFDQFFFTIFWFMIWFYSCWLFPSFYWFNLFWLICLLPSGFSSCLCFMMLILSVTFGYFFIPFQKMFFCTDSLPFFVSYYFS